jgi:hypothetical protein
MGTADEDVQEHRRYGPGDRFGELGFMHGSIRGATVKAVTETVEVFCLRYKSFKRLLGPLNLVQKEHYMLDPRKIMADFYAPGGPKGPAGVCQPAPEESECSTWFAVYRPTSRESITKMLTRVAVGKGLNVKGKSSKAQHLKGFVPFLQISNNDHKVEIEESPADARTKVFFQTKAARESARNAIAQSWELDYGCIRNDDRYASKGLYGLIVPEGALMRCYVQQQDITFRIGWETGRVSEPAFMDMNLHTVRGNSEPEVVLYQYDQDDPLNPHGLLIAYAEQIVKPVVSDFDTFTVGSRGMAYQPLSESQQGLAMWSLEKTLKILETPADKTWSARWLSVMKEASDQGFHPEMPKYGFGDPTSYFLTQAVIEATAECGAVRHGAECFNFYFPQELDTEYLVVWEGFPDKPWQYEDEPGLREFLLERIAEGYSFPLNPVWPVRDDGWYEVFERLRKKSQEDRGTYTDSTFYSWFPSSSGLLEKIQAIHQSFPKGFHLVDKDQVRFSTCSTHVGSASRTSLHDEDVDDDDHDNVYRRLASILTNADTCPPEIADIVISLSEHPEKARKK